ncbi:tRNA 2-selenouridine(34) synthase MnmH [Chrysiogenes arsenatis]|uniref:tRNA 2-selenouridine(34) synthase MnmH n=1 Tax=Chrysiogenes arsenatis TaxID=309797 RepID=UPI000417C608|nr:tRNA 2-selenouridine(34) synthase MnmH [Chrysiogenes arsenatis]
MAPHLPTTADFRRIVLENIPLIDVRAPIEFGKGAFPHAVNLPLMNDQERRMVGTCYKYEGHAKAVALGHRLVNEEVRAPRIAAWADFFRQHDNAMLYCFRGGMRSKISQQWLYESTGLVIPRLSGGYKAFRRFLIEQLEHVVPALFAETITPIVIAGRTGSGKTEVLQQLPNGIDLEGIAHHRGSAFGKHLTPQPCPIDFENQLATALIKKLHEGHTSLVFEDECQNIGSLSIPAPFYTVLRQAPRVILEAPLAERVERTLAEYVELALKQYREQYGDEGDSRWVDTLRQAFFRIRKRLGMARYQHVLDLFDAALQQQKKNGELQHHAAWVELLLVTYYDPMYDYQMENAGKPVLFCGEKDELVSFLASKNER